MPATGHVCQSRNRLEKTLYPQLQMRDSDRPPVSLASLAKMKASGEKIAALTCYDASFAALIDQAGVDVVLVPRDRSLTLRDPRDVPPVTLAP